MIAVSSLAKQRVDVSRDQPLARHSDQNHVGQARKDGENAEKRNRDAPRLRYGCSNLFRLVLGHSGHRQPAQATDCRQKSAVKLKTIVYSDQHPKMSHLGTFV